MSRSYKKTPVSVLTDTYEKRQSNRRIRHTKDICNGSMYKKVQVCWFIKEHWGMHSFNDYKNNLNNWEGYKKEYIEGKPHYTFYTMTEKEVCAEWYKMFKMK